MQKSNLNCTDSACPLEGGTLFLKGPGNKQFSWSFVSRQGTGLCWEPPEDENKRQEVGIAAQLGPSWDGV